MILFLKAIHLFMCSMMMSTVQNTTQTTMNVQYVVGF